MRIKARLFLSLSVVALLCALFLKAGVFLSSPAGDPQRADAIVILGGGDDVRSFRGLELYRKGYAPIVLLTGMEEGEPSAKKYYFSIQARILMGGGVKKQDIVFDTASRNSWQEAQNTLKLAKASGWSKVIVVSEPPHMRRVKYAWGKALKNSGVGFILVSAAPSWWHAERWWSDAGSVRFVMTEYVKLLYYICKY